VPLFLSEIHALFILSTLLYIQYKPLLLR